MTLIIIVFCAGCSEPSYDTIIPQSPAIPLVQSVFVQGDIIAKTVSSPDQFMLILQYDPATGKYERAIVNKKTDGSWFRRNDKSEFIDRTLMEKVYPAKVGHVSSISHVPIETIPSAYIPAQTESVPPTSAVMEPTTRTTIPSPSAATKITTRTPTPSLATITTIPIHQPEIVTTTRSTIGNSSPAIDIPALEMEIHTLINQQRRINGGIDLSYDSSLASIARKHSADMAQNNYFSHVNLQGLDSTARASLDGYSCYKNYGSHYTTCIAENIMQNNLFDSVTYYNGNPTYAWNSQADIAQSTVSSWMSSSGHRQNILASTSDREGIGVAIAQDFNVYITEDFC